MKCYTLTAPSLHPGTMQTDAHRTQPRNGSPAPILPPSSSLRWSFGQRRANDAAQLTMPPDESVDEVLRLPIPPPDHPHFTR
ncbi:hypothetical protein CC80DRAFT_492038 [Byssothecium circinans]|uniref:Uncharacterized protein n=1 Tax=Byssothecium circinans TaxID=147558 RepID=A0A6A5TXM9_9PLEO|nr:hypothetical protein CC80DRAFT_492038 [Byssothecium circinans]